VADPLGHVVVAEADPDLGAADLPAVGSLLARVRMRPTSEPASGSEMQIVAVQSPAARRGAQAAAMSGATWESMCAAGRVAPLSIMKPIAAPSKKVLEAQWSAVGRPWPPVASGRSMASQPPSASWRQASR
jgi:hypothetical protein